MIFSVLSKTAAFLSLLGCAGSSHPQPAVPDARLAPCPSSPNCVSSDARDTTHEVEPLWIRVPEREAWSAVRHAVLELPRTRVVEETHNTLHAECRSALFGFVDDLELELRPEQEMIAVRSASRVGYSDLGVNRRRVETLRKALRRENVVR